MFGPKIYFTVDDWLNEESVLDNTGKLWIQQKTWKGKSKNPWLGGGYLEPLEQQEDC